MSAYRAGRFDEAARAARAAGQVALAGQIEQFATHYGNASSAVRGSPAAMAAMERAIALDNQIVRGGHYGPRLRPQLVAAYLDTAQASLAARPSDACRRVQQALRLDGSNSRAQGLARQCENLAQRLLSEASTAERTDPERARSLYQSILPMVPQSSSAYTGARQRIDALARRRPLDEDE